MSTYEPPTFEDRIDLDLSRNEGRPYLDAIELGVGAWAGEIRRYPDPSRLGGLLAERHGVGKDRVLVTAGGDDAIFRCLLWSQGRTVVTTTPTFEMISRYASQTGALLTEIPWWDGRPPTDAIIGTGADVAVIVSPNNPTGSVIEESDLLRLADRFRLVVLDAAYAEFAHTDLTPTALRLGNVVVVRTLSKAFGLAGLRVGYLLGATDLVGEIGVFGSPYAVSGVSVAIASRVLETGAAGAEHHASAVVEERESLVDLLSEWGAAPLPSQGNFVLATDTDPRALVSGAAALGVGLRRFPDRPGLERCVRIGLPGSAPEFERLVGVLSTVLAADEKEAVDVS